uniref:PLAT domain-containing protein n=1 Tax=Macrostomum lignano TaxID=282301 RepID=A0A1I8FTT6_9PLAT
CSSLLHPAHGNSAFRACSWLPFCCLLALLHHGFRSDAYINVIDSVGDKIAFIFDVTVYPPPIPASVLLEKLTAIFDGSNDDLDRHLQSGNQQAAATTVVCLASVMNAKNEDAEGANASAEKTEDYYSRMTEVSQRLRSNIISIVANFSVDTPEDLEQVNYALKNAIPVDRVNQVTVESQESAAEKLSEISHSFGRIGDKIPADSRAFLGPESTVNSSAASVNGSSHNDTEAQSKVKRVTETVLAAIDSVTDTLLNSSSTYSISDDSLSAQGLKLNGSGTENVTFQSSFGEVVLPSTAGCESVKNENSVSSPVLMIGKQGCRTRRAIDTTDSFEFSLPATTGSRIVVNATPTDRWLRFYHSVNVTSGLLQVTVLPLNQKQNLKVSVQLGRLPTLTDSMLNVSQGSFYLPAAVNESYFIAVGRADCNRDASGDVTAASCPDPVLSYEFGLSLFVCSMWDSSLGVWITPSEDVCRPEPSSVASKPRFVSNLFGSFGVGLNVLPNLIDFGTLFENWQGKLADSAAVVATVVTLWIIFIPIAVWLRHVDKKDLEKFKHLPLVDDCQRQFRYLMDVYTDKYKGCSTTGTPLLSIVGRNHLEACRILSDGVRENLRSGDIDHFTMTTAKHLGDIMQLSVTLEGTRPVFPWTLRKIVITDQLYNATYVFVNSEPIVGFDPPVILKLATKELLAFQPRFVKLNLQRKFQDDHLWMSVFKRDTDTNFSRLQRFGVCFCLLFMTMIANAMFYGVGEESQAASDTISIGPIKLSINTLFTSIMGGLVVIPVSAAVTIFFLKSERKPEPENDEPVDVILSTIVRKY